MFEIAGGIILATMFFYLLPIAIVILIEIFPWLWKAIKFIAIATLAVLAIFLLIKQPVAIFPMAIFALILWPPKKPKAG